MTVDSIARHAIPSILGRSLSALAERNQNASARLSSQDTTTLSLQSRSLPGNAPLVDAVTRPAPRSTRHSVKESGKRATRTQDKGW